ncbi:MAG: hypothetical protein AB8B51_12635 [Sedimentitalea sp.]
MAETSKPAGFFDAFVRPAWVVMMVAQMLLGLALALSLIMKYYMLVFGTLGCVDADTSIANLLRCTPAMELVAQFVLAVAAFRFAAFMFDDKPLGFLPPLVIAIAGLFLLFMTGVSPANASWPMAAVIVTFVTTLATAIGGQVYLRTRARDP